MGSCGGGRRFQSRLSCSGGVPGGQNRHDRLGRLRQRAGTPPRSRTWPPEAAGGTPLFGISRHPPFDRCRRPSRVPAPRRARDCRCRRTWALCQHLVAGGLARSRLCRRQARAALTIGTQQAHQLDQHTALEALGRRTLLIVPGRRLASSRPSRRKCPCPPQPHTLRPIQQRQARSPLSLWCSVSRDRWSDSTRS